MLGTVAGSAEQVGRLPLVDRVLGGGGIDGAVIRGRVRVGVGLERPAVERERIQPDRIGKQQKAVEPYGHPGRASLTSLVLVRCVFLRARAEHGRKRKRNEEPKKKSGDQGHLPRIAPGTPRRSGWRCT